ncbi:unnamed protein product [Leptosia nina]|uniref:Phospholipase D-like domain-containing protein n=1 Tax=Leptosia nina TaxID=320188 RepID=A0AAV1IUT8_9NEOP
MDMFIWKSVVVGLAERIVGITRRLKNNEKSDAINEVLIYGGDTDEWRRQVGLNNLFCILYIIDHAGRTIDISMPSLESDSLTKCLIEVKNRNNIEVRLIVHNVTDLCNLHSLADNGIRVKVIKSAVKLEHEFIIIDGAYSDAVAILGSLDFEVSRVNCCKGTTILSSDCTLISALQLEFNRVWLSHDDENINNFDDSEEGS